MGMADTNTFSNDILDFYIRLMQSLEMSVVEILGVEANKKEFSFKQCCEKYMKVFKNITSSLKLQLIKAIVDLSNVIVKKTLVSRKLSTNHKFELFILNQLKTVFDSHDGVNQAIKQCEKLDINIITINDQHLIDKDDFKKLLLSLLQPEAKAIFNENVNYNEFYSRFFDSYSLKLERLIVLDKALFVFKEDI